MACIYTEHDTAPVAEIHVLGRLTQHDMDEILPKLDAFIDRLLVNDTLNANPAIEAARDRVPKAGLKFQVTTLVCQVTGGPYADQGRSMKDSHAHLNITNAEWDRMAVIFQQVLDRYAVPEDLQQELFAIVGTTKDDIVIEGS